MSPQTSKVQNVSTAQRALRVMVAAAALAMAFIAAPAAAEATTIADPANITVTHTPAQNPPSGCSYLLLGGLTRNVINTGDSFTLEVTAARDLCDPVDVTAVIYSMPGNGVAWPQHRVERHTFNIGDAGVYTIQFTKTCNPQQFDVVVGATPDTIAPWGPWHGWLLFALDTSTALQHWGWECVPPTTVPPVTVPPTTTPEVPPTTVPPVTVPPTTTPEVPPTTVPPTTTPEVPPTTVSEPDITVLDTPTETRTESPDSDAEAVEVAVKGISEPRVAQLALTGGGIGFAGAGWALLAAGCVLLAIRSRRVD